MGVFSWRTADAGESIAVDRPRKSYLLIPKEFGGGSLVEECYEGYGMFGGRDAYALLAQWNDPDNPESQGPDEEARGHGISLAYRSGGVQYPLKFSHSPEAVYEDLPGSQDCEYQGFFYPDDEEEGG